MADLVNLEGKIEELARVIENSDNIVFFGGAGVSTESGIPDFRSESGLYNAEKKYGYSPEEMISKTFFLEKTELFFEYYKENLISATARPNAAHLALAELEKRGKLKAVVTQNIDGLHQMAGSKAVLELHGSNLRQYCVLCGTKYSLPYILGEEGIPKCEKCGGVVRPDVVLYEESLDPAVTTAAIAAIDNAEVLIIGGTSLAVYPAANLIRYFRGNTLVLINKSETSADKSADIVIREPIGKVLGEVVRMI